VVVKKINVLDVVKHIKNDAHTNNAVVVVDAVGQLHN
jgi:hypothetical protein